METIKQSSTSSLGVGEERFLQRLSKKYEGNETPGRFRSYLIASVVILGLFALSRWIPWWGAGLAVVELIGLGLFHQYKRFARFKTRILVKLWMLRQTDCTESGEKTPAS